MGNITDAINSAFRDFATDGVISSGAHEVVKADVRAVGPILEIAIANAAFGSLVDVVKDTKANLDSDLAHAANTVALVYADATDANNDLYIKSGASGSGSWTLTAALHSIIEALAQPYVDTMGALAADAATHPGYADATAVEKAFFDCVSALQIFGVPVGKYVSWKYGFWKDVGTRFNATLVYSDDPNGTNPVDACSYSVASGADTWTSPQRIEMAQVSGSGVTASFIFTPPGAALSMNTASSTTAMYSRRQVSRRTFKTSSTRTADIGAQAASALSLRLFAPQVSAFMGAAGNDTQTGLRNTGFGYASTDALTTGADNTGFGYNALSAATSAQYNSAFGSLCLQGATADGNTGIGYAASASVTTGTQNATVGFQAGYSSNSGSYNTALGARALFSNTSGYYSVAVGYNALFNNTTTGNTAVGESAGFGATTASNYTAIGRRAGYTKPSGVDCTLVGHQAGYAGNALDANNTGDGITAIGAYSFGHTSTGSYNTGCGRASGWYVTTGSRNAYVGYRCGYGNTIGNDNVSMGFYAGHNTSTGGKNVFIGSYADSYVPDSTAMTATAVAGSGLGIGAYSYRVTFVIDGVETGLSETPPAVTTTSGNQQVNLANIPTYTGPRTCSARKIYRTVVGGENLLYLVATISDNATTTYSDTVADGSLGAQPTQISGSIGIGYQARPLKSKQLVFGSTSARVNEVYFGPIDDTAPETVSLRASNASGANVAGASHRVQGGKSTGTAVGGSVILAASPPGSTGNAPNASVDWVTLDGRGFLTIVETTSADVPAPAAGAINLFVEGGALKFRNSAGIVLTVSAS